MPNHEHLWKLARTRDYICIFFGETDSYYFESLNKAAKQITDDIIILATNVEESYEHWKIDPENLP